MSENSSLWPSVGSRRLCGVRFLGQFHHRDTENHRVGTEKYFPRRSPMIANLICNILSMAFQFGDESSDREKCLQQPCPRSFAYPRHQGPSRSNQIMYQELSEEQLWWRPNEESNSVGNLVLHVRGAVLHFLCRGVGGFEYERDRAAISDGTAKRKLGGANTKQRRHLPHDLSQSETGRRAHHRYNSCHAILLSHRREHRQSRGLYDHRFDDGRQKRTQSSI